MCGPSRYNRLPRNQRFLFDLPDPHFPSQQYARKLVQATKGREYALHMLSWKDKGTLASRLNRNSEWFYRGLEAYILWEKKGNKVQSWPMLVLYERAIECAASE